MADFGQNMVGLYSLGDRFTLVHRYTRPSACVCMYASGRALYVYAWGCVYVLYYTKNIFTILSRKRAGVCAWVARAYARMCVCVYAGTRIYIRVCTHIYTRRVTLARKSQSGTGRFSRIGRGHGEVWTVGRGCTGRYVKIFS